MFSPKAIAKKAAEIESNLPIKLVEHTIHKVQEWQERLAEACVPKGKDKWEWKRPLDEEEQQFILNERLMCKTSFPYWAERYAYIRHEKGGDVLIKFRESQEYMLGRIGAIQDQGLPILIINLKARQIYSSTLSELILTYKVTTTSGITSLLAADVPEQSEFLFNMMQRVYEHLPFYLKPHRKYEVKGQQMYFDELDSNILVDSGNRKVGGMGQGKAIHGGHLSELATWNDPDMVTADLIPAILSASSPDTFFILESTAKGKVSRWRDWWLAAKAGKFFGFIPVFIPWHVLKEKYATDPPPYWVPSQRGLALANSLAMTQKVQLTKKQIYWWEQTYESYKYQNKLNEFFAEYASDDEEAFQLSGKSVFSTEMIQDLRRAAMQRPFCPYELQEKGI